MSVASVTKKVTTVNLTSRKGAPDAQKIVAVTCYDYTFARLLDEAVDMILVGDTLGMIVQGESNTLGVTVDDMIYHSRAVANGVHHAHLVVDMPFMSYQTGVRDALKNAGRLLAEGRGESVKLEGGMLIAKTVEKLVANGIPVLGHIGLTPQHVHAFGGYRVQGKTASAREAILHDAVALEDAGAYAIVVEGVPADLGKEITERIGIPTIGIGAGPNCDGQILVTHDLLGMYSDFRPKFVKVFAELGQTVKAAVSQYADEVRSGAFPDPKHSF